MFLLARFLKILLAPLLRPRQPVQWPDFAN